MQYVIYNAIFYVIAMDPLFKNCIKFDIGIRINFYVISNKMSRVCFRLLQNSHKVM